MFKSSLFRSFFVGFFLITLVGCNDGSVPAGGMISVDGEPINNGRIMLNPVDGNGKKAFGIVMEDSTFQLRSVDSKRGVFPGSFRVTVTLKPEISESQRKKLQRQAAGLAIEELTASYTSPEDYALEIGEGGNSDLQIEILTKEGWSKRISD